MTPDESPGLDENAGTFLAAYHEALITGMNTTDGAATTGPQPPGKMERVQACLRRLEDARRASKVPAVRRVILEAQGETGRLGRFQLIRELGRGSYGIVFLAFDPGLRREVAIKVPRPETLVTPELRRRFLREAQAAAGLNHPHIVPVYEAGEEGQVCYIASAYCPGLTLADWLRQQASLVAPSEAARIAAALAEAVEHAHSRGVLHRDLKPSNILLEANGPASMGLGIPKLTDFGLAKLIEGDGDDTRSGVILGTPSYMAPEQADGRRQGSGPGADIYSLGCILYEMLTGRPPFKGTTALETLAQVRTDEPVPPSRLHPHLPRDLETICLKCLRKEPAQRFASAGELAADLNRFLTGQPIHARPASFWTHFALWCRRPERMRDAGMMAMGMALVLTLFCVAMLFAVYVTNALPRTEHPSFLLQGVAIILVVCYVPMFWLGWKTLGRRGWAIRAGTGIAFCFLGYMLMGVCSVLGDFDTVYGTWESRLPFNLLVMFLAVVLVFLHITAISAHRASQQHTGQPLPRPDVEKGSG